jgi:hypothetical protein
MRRRFTLVAAFWKQAALILFNTSPRYALLTFKETYNQKWLTRTRLSSGGSRPFCVCRQASSLATLTAC